MSFKVLSIDWDYFLDASEDTRITMFPDSGNETLPSMLADFIWASRYAFHALLKKIKVDSVGMAVMKGLLKAGITPNTQVNIASSHRHIYDLILRRCGDRQLELYNVDFHSDLFSQNVEKGEITCGNWLRTLMTDERFENAKVYWIGREDSPEENSSSLLRCDLTQIPHQEFDMVFLCRSDMWSPPHLDTSFLSLVRLMQRLSYHKVSIIEGVDKSRYTAGMRATIQEHKEVNERIRREHMDVFSR